MFAPHPLLILAVGIVVVVGMIMVLRINAFIALITAAMAVSLLAPGGAAEKISRVAEAFGSTAGKIGVVIAFAVVIGRCMMASGAADRIVSSFLSVLGEKRGSIGLMSSAFVLSIPVFFDTVFYLLIPLARSMYQRTQKNYLKYVMAVVAGAAVTHTLVPPTPGPLIMAENLGVDLGVMIMVGVLVAIPLSIVGIIYAGWIDKRMHVPMRPLGDSAEAAPPDNKHLPGLAASILPIILPVLLISSRTIASAVAKTGIQWPMLGWLVNVTDVLGNANLAMLLSAAIAMYVLGRHRKLSRRQMSQLVEVSLMSGGIIILITSAGGAFGAMLKTAQIGPAIEGMFNASGQEHTGGLMLLGLGFVVSAVLKMAQGSGTVAMITSSAMLASMITSPESLGYHPVYLAIAVGCGSLIGSWMNDSGFWVVAKMAGFTEAETLKSWTLMLIVLGVAGLAITMLLATFMPLV